MGLYVWCEKCLLKCRSKEQHGSTRLLKVPELYFAHGTKTFFDYIKGERFYDSCELLTVRYKVFV